MIHAGAWHRPAIAARHASTIHAAIMLAVATLACAAPPASAPGFELVLAPLFYLPAMRWFTMRAVWIVALATIVPTLVWAGHPIFVVVAIGHILLVRRFYSADCSFSTITVPLYATTGALVGLLLLTQEWSPAVELALVSFLRTVLPTVVLAALADGLVLVVAHDRATGRWRLQRAVSITSTLDALVSMAIAGAATLVILSDMRHVPQQVLGLVQTARAAVSAADARGLPQGTHSLAVPGHGAPLSMTILGHRQPLTPALAGRAGCARLDSGAAPATERGMMGYWLRTCIVQPLSDGRIAIVSPRPIVRSVVRDLLLGLVPLGFYLILAECALAGFRRAIRRSVAGWNAALSDFDRSLPTRSTPVPFTETQALLERFRTINDELLTSRREQDRLSRAVDELRATMGLRLFSDVHFDPAACRLHFVKLDPQTGRRDMTVAVHPGDRETMAGLAIQSDVTAEFRIGTGADAEWHMLLAHDYDPAIGGWRSGCIVRLRTSKAFEAKMRHHARLIELGGMASALNHELRQPLFTIALAAENGRMALRLPDRMPDATRKFDTIIEQVERVTAIVDRTSAYARLERDGREPTDLVQAIDNAMRFMRPLVNSRGIELHLSAPPALPLRELPRVGIEQIIVNAIQNAADSIDVARAHDPDRRGVIGVEVAERDGMLRIAVTDTGAGVADDMTDYAFDAFSTTKPVGKGTGLGLFVCRQIIDEVGGSITLRNNMDGPGASLTLVFPPDRKG